MEWWVIGLNVLVVNVLVVAAIFDTERLARTLRRDIARLDGKVNRLLKQMNIDYEQPSPLSERVKELARDPDRKIEAIRVYREETGAGLSEAKDAVEGWLNSMQR